MAEYRYLGKPDEEWLDFPKRLPPGTRIDGMTRDRLPIIPQPGLTIEEQDVSARDKVPIRIRTYRQTGSTSPLPLLIYMHGGGYVTGSLETDDRYCRLIAEAIEILVLSIEYRLAPEYKFPTGWQDSQDVLRWAATAAGQDKLKVNLRRGFFLGGTSAGANFTAGLSHMAVHEKLPYPLTGVMFLAGSFCHPDARPQKYSDRILSIDEIHDAPGLTRKSIDHFIKQYGAPPTDKRLSPLLFESHEGIAKKAYFSVCGWDPRRDEALLLEQLLKDVNIETKLDVYPGLPHGFWTTCPELAVSKSWEQDLVAGVKWLV